MVSGAGACERNWSACDFVHSKKRNRLDPNRLKIWCMCSPTCGWVRSPKGRKHLQIRTRDRRRHRRRGRLFSLENGGSMPCTFTTMCKAIFQHHFTVTHSQGTPAALRAGYLGSLHILRLLAVLSFLHFLALFSFLAILHILRFLAIFSFLAILSFLLILSFLSNLHILAILHILYF